MSDRDWTLQYELRRPERLLGHYTSASTAFEHIVVPGGKLRLGRYSAMQDPAENKEIVPNFAVPSEPEDAQQRVEEAFREHRDDMRVLCLTRDADVVGSEWPQFDCCWSRPRMWEQYGDRHRGVCLVFDRARLERAISAQWAGETIYMRDVQYAREGIATSNVRDMFSFPSVADDDVRRAVAGYTAAHHDALFFLKRDDFATEFEYRVVLGVADDKPADVEAGSSLVAVVLGEKFPIWQRVGAMYACSRIGKRVGLMHWSRGLPRVVKMNEPNWSVEPDGAPSADA